MSLALTKLIQTTPTFPSAASCGFRYGSKCRLHCDVAESSAIIGHFLLAVGNNALHIHRLQIAIVLAVALVFSVFGCEFLFDSRGALIAVGVAWLLLTMVNLVWILYLTSEEESPFYRFLYAGGPRKRETYTEQSYPAFSGYAPTATDATPQKVQVREPTPQPTVLRAKAMYAYSADPSDSNEVSFAKGDILEVLDNSGKWWQVKTPSGAVGIAPSNYCSLIDAA